MNTVKKFLITTLMTACIINAYAQTNEGTPAYRQKGYAGSVSFTDQYIVWLGLDTSHGYMFNEHHYLGAGAGFFLAPVDDVPPTVIHVYGEYKGYILKKRSTPVAGIKAGYSRFVTDKSGQKFSGAFELDPSIGWDWGLKNGKGLNLSVGASLLMANRNVTALPKISFGFQF